MIHQLTDAPMLLSQRTRQRSRANLLVLAALMCLTGPLSRPVWSAEAAEAIEGSTNRPPCCRKLMPASAPTDRSLYQLDSVWTSDVGRKVPLRVLQGRPQVVAMFFTHCEFACPITLHDLKRIQESLPPEIRNQVDFLLVTLDPERDTPAVLAKYRKQQHLGTKGWTLLTGSADDIRELAALLGVNYRKDERGQYAHSNIISILNRDGEVIHQQVGLNKAPEDTIQALRKCVERSKP